MLHSKKCRQSNRVRLCERISFTKPVNSSTFFCGYYPFEWILLDRIQLFRTRFENKKLWRIWRPRLPFNCNCKCRTVKKLEQRLETTRREACNLNGLKSIGHSQNASNEFQQDARKQNQFQLIVSTRSSNLEVLNKKWSPKRDIRMSGIEWTNWKSVQIQF